MTTDLIMRVNVRTTTTTLVVFCSRADGGKHEKKGNHGVGYAVRESIVAGMDKGDVAVESISARLMKVRIRLNGKSNGVSLIVGYDQAATENHSRRMAHGDPRPARTPSSRGQRSSFFQGFCNEAVVQHVTYVSDSCRVGGRVVYPSWGTTPRNFHFSGTGVVASLQPVKQLGKAGRGDH